MVPGTFRSWCMEWKNSRINRLPEIGAVGHKLSSPLDSEIFPRFPSLPEKRGHNSPGRLWPETWAEWDLLRFGPQFVFEESNLRPQIIPVAPADAIGVSFQPLDARVEAGIGPHSKLRFVKLSSSVRKP